MSGHSVKSRSVASPASTRDPTYDVIVIGGGINGVAIARDVAMRGLSVLLLEKEDLSHAASAWNSRMIHGGIKYLETYEIRLVRESLREREWLLRAAPHLVKPYPFLMPFLRRNRRPPWLLRLGMLAYDVLSLDKSLPRHRILDAARIREEAPGLPPEEVRGGALFYDAQAAYAERLGIETAVSAHEHGATIVTRRQVTRILRAGPEATGVEWADRITGETGVANARVIVNATGAWVDQLLEDLPGHERPLSGPSKGTHLVVDQFPGAPRVALYYEAKRDGRAVLVLPWRGRWLIGSTDIRVEGDIDGVRADDAELEYILSETNDLIPEAGLTRASIRFVYTGVRPLPYAGNGDVGTVTRDHIVHDHAPAVDGLYSIVGGKLTTFRALGEQAGDIVARKLGNGRRSSTRSQVLPGARTADMEGFAARLVARTGIDPASARRLVGIYGVRAEAILDRAKAEPRLASVLDERHHVTAAEVVHAVETEFARTLTDVLMRRTMVGLDPDVEIGAVESIAEAMGRHEGWSQERVAREVDDFLTIAQRARPNASLTRLPVLATPEHR